MTLDYWKLNPITAADPSQATALALIETMESGVGEFDHHVAERCWMIFGLPQLEPVAVARWMAERSMRPRSPEPAKPDDTIKPVPDHSYGLGPRK